MMKHLATAMLILIIKLETSSAELPDIFTRIVNIKNDLGGGIHLATHCQSADDDLGVRDLSNGQFTEWKFRVTLIGKTLYWCSMKWNDIVRASFDVYDDDKFWCLYCYYSVRQDGVYLHNLEKDTWEMFHPWK